MLDGESEYPQTVSTDLELRSRVRANHVYTVEDPITS